MRGLYSAMSGFRGIRFSNGLNKRLFSSSHGEPSGPSTAPVEDALKEALDFCSYIDQSADQAYLEADPATRTTKDVYIMRYQYFAKSGLEKAIQKYEGLYTHIGETGMKELKRQDVNFALVVADSLLARDKLDRALKSGQERLKEKHVSGLKRDDLVFCDD